VKTPHRSNLTTEGSKSEQFIASGPLHPANRRRDPGFWLVHGSKEEPCSRLGVRNIVSQGRG
jgi:hypothetical protein